MENGDAAILGSIITGVCGIVIAIISRPKSNQPEIYRPAPQADNRIEARMQRKKPPQSRKKNIFIIAGVLIFISIIGFIISIQIKKNEKITDPSATTTPITLPDVDYRELCSRRIQSSDLEGKTIEELSLIRNTIYAMHGYNFYKNPKLIKYFNSKPWYQPRPEFTDNELKPWELDNIKLLVSRESYLKGNK